VELQTTEGKIPLALEWGASGKAVILAQDLPLFMVSVKINIHNEKAEWDNP
jgi:hypothetical protein